MRLMLDLVPNHMGVLKADNAWWLDVLEHGQASRYADYFDIDWAPADETLAGKVLVPILGDQYGAVLERGELALRFAPERGELSLWYYEHRLPVRPAEYPRVLLAQPAPRPGRRRERAFAASRVASPPFPCSRRRGATRRRSARPPRRALADCARARRRRAARRRERRGDQRHCRATRAASTRSTRCSRGQAYRLAFWRVAADDINYRRFFDINDLAGLRAEREDVFEATHRRVLELVAQGKADCLRIDHPDGLADPGAVFRAPASRGLRRVAQRARRQGARSVRRGREDPGRARAAAGHVAGARRHGLPLHARGQRAVRRSPRANCASTGCTRRSSASTWTSTTCCAARRRRSSCSRSRAISTASPPRLRASSSATAVRATSRGMRSGARWSRSSPRFPVYRTYVTQSTRSGEDRRYVDWAVAVAKRHSAAADTSVLRLHRAPCCAASTASRRIGRRRRRAALRHALPAVERAGDGEGPRGHVVLHLQPARVAQRSRRRSARCSARPSARSTAHAGSARRAGRIRCSPRSTHDNKRSEDVRARIDVLSEMPGAWRLALRRWRQFNRRHRSEVDGEEAPSRNDEYLLYQTLVGAWPLGKVSQRALDAFRARIQAYMQKAVREAKVAHELDQRQRGVRGGARAVRRRRARHVARNPFLDDFLPLAQRIAFAGCVNSLAQTTLKLTAPGVPDTYQGTELWDFSLVDPDNRRPVDYAAREAMLRKVQRPRRGGAARDMAGRRREDAGHGAACSSLRKRRAAWFERATYRPVRVRGTHRNSVCAFMRSAGGSHLLCVVPRLWQGIVRERSDVADRRRRVGRYDAVLDVPVAQWRNVVTGEVQRPLVERAGARLAVGAALATFPVAVLRRDVARYAASSSPGFRPPSPSCSAAMSRSPAANARPLPRAAFARAARRTGRGPRRRPSTRACGAVLPAPLTSFRYVSATRSWAMAKLVRPDLVRPCALGGGLGRLVLGGLRSRAAASHVRRRGQHRKRRERDAEAIDFVHVCDLRWRLSKHPGLRSRRLADDVTIARRRDTDSDAYSTSSCACKLSDTTLTRSNTRCDGCHDAITLCCASVIETPCWGHGSSVAFTFVRPFIGGESTWRPSAMPCTSHQQEARVC